jgi:hypothetical protein
MLPQRNISYLAFATGFALPMLAQASDKAFDLVLNSEAHHRVSLIGEAMQNWG